MCTSQLRCISRGDRHPLTGSHNDQWQQKLIPGPQTDKNDHRGRRWSHQGEDNAPKEGELAGAIQHGQFIQLPRNILDKSGIHKNRKGQ